MATDTSGLTVMMLNDDQFHARYGQCRAKSGNAHYVMSAILQDGTHVYFDHTLNDYVRKAR